MFYIYNIQKYIITYVCREDDDVQSSSKSTATGKELLHLFLHSLYTYSLCFISIFSIQYNSCYYCIYKLDTK